MDMFTPRYMEIYLFHQTAAIGSFCGLNWTNWPPWLDIWIVQFGFLFCYYDHSGDQPLCSHLSHPRRMHSWKWNGRVTGSKGFVGSSLCCRTPGRGFPLRFHGSGKSPRPGLGFSESGAAKTCPTVLVPLHVTSHPVLADSWAWP